MFFFLTYLTLYIIGSSFIYLIRTDTNAFFFNGWVIFHCVFVLQLSYPFICQWTSRLLSYCKQCKHVLAIVNIGVQVSLSILLSSVCKPSCRIAGSYGNSISRFFFFFLVFFFFTSSFLRKSLHCSP